MAKIAKTHEDIEAQILEIQGMKAALLEEGDQGVGLDSTGFYDQEIYGGSDSRFAGYVTSIAANEQEEDDEEDSSTTLLGQKKPGYHAPVAILNSIPQSDEQYDPFAEHRPQKISDREDEYKRRRQKMIISPERHDPFADAVLLCQSCLHSLKGAAPHPVLLFCRLKSDCRWTLGTESVRILESTAQDPATLMAISSP
ncbi:splicing factor 3B subunit 1 isoform X4 [Tachysurus vachellii]|uniref:splicing factor 3B subunit 1 isoform X4 n=1 Tax=Tachysurus vachellii TaxID=175792 RepID=UPI00296B0E29|nr:splicing factor 3B subunit 1 isoform X4 [Tachysurus vachellii]